MIMPAKESNCYSKLFTKILHEAHKHWGEFRYNPENKTASGLLVTSNGKVLTAELSFDDIKNLLSLIARLPVKKELDTTALRQIIRYQNQHRNLCSFITVDDECGIVSIIANTPVYYGKPSLPVACIFKAAYAILEDQELNELLN